MLTCTKCGSSVALPADPKELTTSCARCGSSVDLASMRTMAEPAAPAAADDTLAPGRALAGYRIEQLLGRGGMAAVYKATQLSLNRPVAIKVLPRALAQNPAFVTRFGREAGALASLNHPNIINIIDRGSEGDLYYFVMEFVDGTDLHARLASQTPRPAEAIQIVLQVCAALEYAHKRGIIHRDIKPGNIMLDRNGTVKVTDFGIAHLAGTQDTGFGLTMAGAAMGTVNYMAPEQRTDARTVDGRADIYALGVMLYEMLALQLPLGAFEPPSKLVPGLDPRLDAVVTKALKQDPRARFASARELAAALQPLAMAGPTPPPEAQPTVVAPPPSLACPHCRSENHADARFCLTCGKTLIESCPKCRKNVRAGARFCDACGTNIGEYLTQVMEDLKTRIATAARLETEGKLAEAITTLDGVLGAEGPDLDEVKAKAKERKAAIVAAKEKLDAEFRAGQDLYDRKEFEKAIAAWVKLPATLAYAQEAIGEAKKRIESREQALREAAAAHAAGRFEEALQHWQRAADLVADPAHFRAKMEEARAKVAGAKYVECNRRATQAAAAQDHATAEAAWAEALKWKPDDPLAKSELQKAEILKRGAERDAQIAKGDQAAATGKHKEAMDCWQKAVALLVPDNPQIRAELNRKIQAARTKHGQEAQKLILILGGAGVGFLFLVAIIVAIVLIASKDDKKSISSPSGSGASAPRGAGTSHELFESMKQAMRSKDLEGLWNLHSGRFRGAKNRDQFNREVQNYFGPWNPNGFNPDYMTAVPGEPTPYGDGYVFAWTYGGYAHAHFMVRLADGWWLEGMIR
ncbi:MAG: protein kinase [Planctomycetes bacterium]|nr:protein kinase [Planctomycetota bacterium]